MINIRLPHWLWAAKIFPTEAVAREQITKGNIKINNKNVSPKATVQIGDTIKVRTEKEIATYFVNDVQSKRNSSSRLCTKLEIQETEFCKQKNRTNRFLGRNKSSKERIVTGETI